MKFVEEIWKISQQQAKFRHGKFNMNDLKSFKKCLVAYKILKKTSMQAQLGITLAYIEK